VAVDPVDEALRRSESSFRAPRMVDADDTSALDGAVRWVLCVLRQVGLVWDVKTPETLPYRANLVLLNR
jgi:hypothetical protein